MNPRQISKNAFAGSAAALLAENGKVYTGVCIDTPCSMGFCAEHATIAAMVTDAQTRILKIVAVEKSGAVIPPCGRCREFILQIDDQNDRCEVLLPAGEVRTGSELLPVRWE